MPYINAWFHLVWATRNRLPLLGPEIKNLVFEHIQQNAKEKNIYLEMVNGHTDHIHCLVSLSCDQTLSEIVQMIKGESSFWINKQKLSKRHFAWQDEYFAISVSPAHLDNVRNYITNQEDQHKKITWNEEYEMFLNNYRFKRG